MRFGDFCEIQPSVSLKKGSEYPFLPMEDVNPSSNIVRPQQIKTFSGGGARFSSRDTIFARITPCLENGKIAQVVVHLDADGFGSTEFLVFRARPEISDPDYLFYLSKSHRIVAPAIKSMVGSSGRQRARKEVIAEIEVPYISLPQQVKIASILRAFDELVQNNRRRITLLEQAARLIYREWFVHLRFPGHERANITNGIPNGWESHSASDAILINPKVDWNRQREIKMLPMAGLSESVQTIDRSVLELRSTPTGVRFMNGDTLFARITPCLENGKTAFVSFLDDGEIACGSTEFIVFREQLVSRYFIYLLAREESFRNNAIKSMIGSSGRQRVQPSCFDKYILAVPPTHVAANFDDQVKPIFLQIELLEKEAVAAQNAIDVLLPRLMDGRVEV